MFLPKNKLKNSPKPQKSSIKPLSNTQNTKKTPVPHPRIQQDVQHPPRIWHHHRHRKGLERIAVHEYLRHGLAAPVHRLHLLRRHVLALRELKERLRAVHHRQRAVRIQSPHVTRVQPPALQRGRRGLRVLQVPFEHARPAHQDLAAGRIGRGRVQRPRHRSQPDAQPLWQPHMPQIRVVALRERDRGERLGKPVALVHVGAQHHAKELEDVRRAGRAAGDQQVQAVETHGSAQLGPDQPVERLGSV